MPELPEVETIARGLSKRVTGDGIESVWLGQKPELLKSSAQEIAATLENRRIVTVRRVGKHIVFDLALAARAPSPGKGRSSKSRPEAPAVPASIAAQFIVHLGMTGRLQVSEGQSEILKHTH